ncbi:peptide-N(4)-(N-acetyl-beta-glucosaminyl)asparagine amidase isoform X2 [Phragmites australis]|uniref:peptide-N(4)-(N-acetyl-beta- glucosaminyl)asparagine amidase isoform X2 n=1 Tax=Phragmites australis TaxID=29695 RepID=UPI002D7723E8|nr:peptide-N(4)-(N-acetyl-beta-glucosaminyl)asparagine amidase isoform X2 [Phragmites australis]
MVARQFVVRQGPAAGGEGEAEEHAVEYDTEHGVDVLRLQIFSLTSVPPDLQKIVVEADGSVVDDGTDLEVVSERLRLVPIDEEEVEGEAAAEAAMAQEKSDEELARMLQAEEEALLLQQYTVRNDGGEVFRQRVEPYMHQVLMYEDPVRQEAARKTVPINELEEKALVSLAKEGNFSPSKDEEDQAFLLQLLFWFKQSFSWVNAAPCESCGRETSSVGMGTPLPSEIEFGASRVEIYRCNHCSSITRFPRYNDPYKLLQTRKGRCGEWANCFTFYCRAFGYEARLILDFTDHVWTECFSNLYGRWMHLDPCEGVYDNPLLYEKGWNKKLNYVIAISKDGVRDVTKRYTRKWHEVLSRRTFTSEDTISTILASITGKYRTNLSTDALSVIQNREKEESEELSKSAYLQFETTLSLPGRLSGSVEWRKARSELGQADSLSCSSCPVRKCVDAHVSEIYNALSALLSHFYDREIPKERIIEVFDAWKTLMLNLKDANFKSRRATLEKTHQLFEEIFPSIERLLSAISLKAELGTDGHRSVTVVGNPIHSSLALPVALDAVDEILSNYKNNIFCTDANQFPRGNRLCSGSVLASREQLPIGIATAAFDGIHSSKWEEPDGAKGCWLIYKMLDGQTCELESYDLMSANDAPERDPMDWVVEGSADEGSTWNTIDTRSSELFESRFCRKTFTVDKRYKANAFRFRFLRVRESNANPRFQIGSIDLYGETI